MTDTDGCTANDIVIEKIDEEEESKPQPNTMQDTIKEMGKSLLERYPEKLSNLSYENCDGMTQADVLNEYMEINFGYRFKALDKLVNSKQSRVVSVGGFGIAAFNDLVKSIQATFEQHQLPENIKGLGQYLRR